MKIPNNTLFIKATRDGQPAIIWKTPHGWTGAVWDDTPATACYKMYNFCNRDHISAMIDAGALANVSVISAEKVPEDLLRQFPGLDERVIRHYERAYTWSEDVDDITTNLSFYDVWQALERREDVYMYIGPYSDSITRERIFTRLAEILQTDYEYIYQLWLAAV